MQSIQISLFGQFSMRCGAAEVTGLESAKAQELLCYLLINRDRPHPREWLASQLWGNYCTTSQSRKYLRNALWALKSVIKAFPDLEACGLLDIDAERIRLCSSAKVLLDIAYFEKAYYNVEDVPGTRLTNEDAALLEQAVEMYKGNLLVNWQKEWCLFERERLLQMYLSILDKLMGYCEMHHRYEHGLAYGRRVLFFDQARECTHRHMMRLYARAGDRTSAIRQFQKCTSILHTEMGIKPSERTKALHDEIMGDRFRERMPFDTIMPDLPTVSGLSDRLESINQNLCSIQVQLKKTIESVENLLPKE